ncbi:hypothetical protein FPV67DRAFT_593371 [Lyophyllum atratum]|nr:hypothetical protein FPV67DRAFT_593371 [Lyophyllum atratum]
MCFMLFLYDLYACRHQLLTQRQHVDCHIQNCITSNCHLEGEHKCEEACVRRNMEERSLVNNTVDEKCPTCIYGLH